MSRHTPLPFCIRNSGAALLHIIWAIHPHASLWPVLGHHKAKTQLQTKKIPHRYRFELRRQKNASYNLSGITITHGRTQNGAFLRKIGTQPEGDGREQRNSALRGRKYGYAMSETRLRHARSPDNAGEEASDKTPHKKTPTETWQNTTPTLKKISSTNAQTSPKCPENDMHTPHAKGTNAPIICFDRQGWTRTTRMLFTHFFASNL